MVQEHALALEGGSGPFLHSSHNQYPPESHGQTLWHVGKLGEAIESISKCLSKGSLI